LPAIHRDPFDRLLVVQSLAEPMTILTNDALLVRYGPLVQLVPRRSREVDHLRSAGVTQARNSLRRVDEERDREQSAVIDRYSRDLDHTGAAERDDARSE